MGIAVFDVADRACGRLNASTHAFIAFRAGAHWPIGHLVHARTLRKFLTDGAEMLAEHVGCSAAVGSHNNINRLVRKLGSGVRLSDERIVPFLDLAQEDS